MTPSARDRFLSLLRAAAGEGSLTKLTLGKYRGSDPTLRNLFVRPVSLKAGRRFSFVWRHTRRDSTQNHPAEESLALLEPLIGGDFLDAHLFTSGQSAQLECRPDGSAKLRIKEISAREAADCAKNRSSRAERDNAGKCVHALPHDEPKSHLIPADAPWLRALGVTNDAGRPREGMAPKFRQIQKFAELITHLTAEAGLSGRDLRVVDMGSGKGYLTFAISGLLGARARVLGIEARSELVDLCNRAAVEHGFSPQLEFKAGAIADAALGDPPDVLIALHACDTATDDALARGIAAGASLLIVAPCCQKELRPRLSAPPVLADALRHGIFQERQAEFVTDSLRAQLLEWSGYRAKVFEFISTEHTAKNLLIAGIKSGPGRGEALAARIRAFASFYGIRGQRLADLLGFALA